MIDSTDLITLYGKTYSVKQITKEKDEYIRLEAINYDFALSELAHDVSPLVRAAVARKKVGHAHLAYDSNWRVRATVAQHCSDIALILHLARDENDFVRYLIINRGYAAEYLSNDPDQEIASLARENLRHAQAA